MRDRKKKKEGDGRFGRRAELDRKKWKRGALPMLAMRDREEEGRRRWRVPDEKGKQTDGEERIGGSAGRLHVDARSACSKGKQSGPGWLPGAATVIKHSRDGDVYRRPKGEFTR